jgi:hypothetical protein
MFFYLMTRANSQISRKLIRPKKSIVFWDISNGKIADKKFFDKKRSKICTN